MPQGYSYVLDQKSFAEQLNVFRTHRRCGQLTPIVTFDDGHSSDYDVAFPLLMEKGMTAHFFITAGWMEKRHGYMKWDQVRELHAAGHSIGAHGFSHKLFTHCDGKGLQYELVSARKLLEDKLGAPVTALSFPGGRFNKRILSACQDAGYVKMFTSIPRVETLPTRNIIGRLNVRGDWTLSFITRLLDPESGVLQRLERQEKLKALAKTILGDALYGWIWAIANRKGSGENQPVDRSL